MPHLKTFLTQKLFGIEHKALSQYIYQKYEFYLKMTFTCGKQSLVSDARFRYSTFLTFSQNFLLRSVTLMPLIFLISYWMFLFI